MTPQELKNSILQLAIQGKLVEQRPEEGTAEELMAQITLGDNVDGQRVKQKMIAQITEDEKVFEIPENWAWVKLGKVCVIARGGSPRPIKEYITTAEDGVNWIKIGDTEKNGKYISSTAEKIKPSGVSKSRMVHVGDFLLTNSMSFGRPYILKVDGCIHDGWLVISQINKIFDQDYLYWMLSSNYAYMQFCGKASGAVVKNLNSDKVANSVFPLPPLAEQKRIVAKIEELLPYIDRYEQAWSKLEQFNSRFPEDMKKSLLQYAIQGKLVEQRPEEGTAEELFAQIQQEKQRLIAQKKIKKEKPLPEITEDEKPFDIPESWKWVHLNYIASSSLGKTLDKAKNTGDLQPYLCSINVYWNGISLEKVKEARFEENELSKYLLQKGDLLICEGGDVGRSSVWEHDVTMYYQNALHRVRFYQNINPYFYKYLIECYKGIGIIDRFSKGVTIKHLVQNSLNAMWLPLPPLAEQKRIVEKLEQLLQLCEKLIF
ncbi:restriction endonuclease subunit S [Pseudoflavonifractor phocaeensis]|uniref:restriction endonuclease subunit S n=1 Tax=Pseudoflavonifractor phocaeensis TaxID=1870988 RepID=UPI0025A4BF37|nr:restriction endonuclease subunit S [Pseudoflavonifractor phocaeensis]MDM8238771.1 restriction endonuclease subunit S [Pseudoflavonifractor phocaeensis]